MDVFLTGATGFVGRTLLARLVETGHQVRCLVRPASKNRLARPPEGAGGAVIPVPGDCLDPSSLPGAMSGCRAVIHLVGIIREFPGRGVTFERLHVEATQNVVRAAVQNGVGRFLQMSALGARNDAPSRYHRTKFQAEQLVARSGLDYVIFRPSIIFGPGDDFINRLARLVRPWFPAPVLGDGRGRLQPVAVENVADGFERAIMPPGCVNRTFEVGGTRPYSMLEILDAVGRAKGRRRVRKIHLPLPLMQRLARRFEHWRFFPFTSEQILMLQEDNICAPQEFLRTFAIEPVEFEAGIARYIGRRPRR